MRLPTYVKHRERHRSEGFFVLKVTPGPGMCMVSRCRNDGHPHKFSLCHRHYQARWRMLNPKQSAYAALRDHARSRGIEFKLDYMYFLGLTDAYAYWDSTAESFGEYPSLDRIDGSRGYIQGNVRIVTVSQNCRKAAREKFLPANVQAILDRKRARAMQDPHLSMERDPEACPF